MTANLIRERDAAERLGIAPKTLTRWRWAGKGPRFVKIGGAVRYAEADLVAFIVAGAVDAGRSA